MRLPDFLLGNFSGASVFQPAGFGVEGKVGNPRQFNFWYLAPYIQDDWKVNQRLTLNLGLRYDFRIIPTESNDRMGWRDLSNPLGGLLVADENLVDTGIVGDQSYYRFAGRRNPADASKRVFAPRFGFAFRPFSDDKTVVRGGYGIFFDSAEGREIDGAADIFPYVSRGNYTQSLGQANLHHYRQPLPGFCQRQGGHTRRQHLPGGEYFTGTAQPIRSAMVAGRATLAHAKDHPRIELHRIEGNTPADAAQHCAGSCRSQSGALRADAHPHHG